MNSKNGSAKFSAAPVIRCKTVLLLPFQFYCDFALRFSVGSVKITMAVNTVNTALLSFSFRCQKYILRLFYRRNPTSIFCESHSRPI